MTEQQNTITFRTKFRPLLKSDDDYHAAIAFTEKFIAKKPNEAFEMLWRMTYSEPVDEIDFFSNGFSEVDTLALRNELYFQYKNANPGLLALKLDDKFKDSYTILKNHTDEITSIVVYNRCQEYLLSHSSQDFERAIHLLNSSMENMYFGGIRELGFDWYEAQYLKFIHVHICKFLTDIVNTYKFEINSQLNTPFSKLGEKLANTGIGVLESKEEATEETSKNSDIPLWADNTVTYSFEILSPEAVLSFMSVFTRFVENDMSSLQEIVDQKFDLNEVFLKRAQIKTFLEAAKALSK